MFMYYYKLYPAFVENQEFKIQNIFPSTSLFSQVLTTVCVCFLCIFIPSLLGQIVDLQCDVSSCSLENVHNCPCLHELREVEAYKECWTKAYPNNIMSSVRRKLKPSVRRKLKHIRIVNLFCHKGTGVVSYWIFCFK